jgi:NADPH2:quinone reductase
MDVMARRGDPGYATSWPFVAGIEVAGTVREVGAGVAGLSVGQRVAAVTAGGGLAEVAIARAGVVVPVPEEVSLATAAAAPTGMVSALLLLDTARFVAGGTVLVHSASGGIGAAVAQLVPILGGGRLIGTVGRPDKVGEAERLGYAAAIARDEGLAGLADLVLKANDGKGVDVVLDPLGTTMLEVDVAVTAAGGRIVLFGNASGGAPGPLPGLGQLIGGNITISGFSHRGLASGAPARVSSALERILGHLSSGQLDVPLTVVPSLGEVPAVHQLMAEGKGSGKYVVALSASPASPASPYSRSSRAS